MTAHHSHTRQNCANLSDRVVCFRPNVFPRDKYNRAEFNDELERIISNTTAPSHSIRGCMIPGRRIRFRVITRSEGSQVVLLDLCTGVPATSRSTDPKMSKVLSVTQVQQGLKELYAIIEKRARASPGCLPMVLSTVKAMSNTFCTGMALDDACTAVGEFKHEKSFNDNFKPPISGQDLIKQTNAPLIVFQPVPTVLPGRNGKPAIKVHTAVVTTVSKRNFRSETGYFSEEIADAIVSQHMHLCTNKTIC